MERFWSKTCPEPNTGCLLWCAGASKYGFFQVKLADGAWVKELAHRVSWTLTYGAIPVGAQVLHRCDTPLCVNPAHLFLGTAQDNVADMVAKGRQARGASHGSATQPEATPRGEAHYNARITALQVRAIRCLYEDGFTQSEIAEAFGMTQANVSAIVLRKTWTLVA